MNRATDRRAASMWHSRIRRSRSRSGCSMWCRSCLRTLAWRTLHQERTSRRLTTVVVIERHAVGGHYQDLAAVVAGAGGRALVDIRGREGEVPDVAIFDHDVGPLQVVPLVHRSVGIADEARPGIVRHAHVLPVVDIILGHEVVGDARIPPIHRDVVAAPAVPDHRVFGPAVVQAGGVRLHAQGMLKPFLSILIEPMNVQGQSMDKAV